MTIPTYEVGKPEKNPMFLEKRVYQGSSGVVYPYPVIETMSDEKVDKEYLAIWIENEYIKVMILPELGGRVQMAYDKIAKRHFVYYNHVIKPALVGLLGPWISGGIEFNWPQHHRPTTYMPVDTCIEENADGSVSVWVSEMEKMFHQKGMAGFTLRPGCAYLEIKGRVYNRTDVPQTFLWWANPAVYVNDAYQSVFPPDINAVFDHGKRAVSSFPIATGTYYKMDYSAGVDISNYKNIFVPTSYMGVNSRFNFEGGYENDTRAGMLHVASHHFSPGKKQWTWGNGDFGRAWDRNLTDEAPLTPPEGGWKGEVSDYNLSTSREGTGIGQFRPYIELMAGVYTENQPDFTWLMPYEEKLFTQYFMPYRELGVVKEASKDFLFNISLTPDPSPARPNGTLSSEKRGEGSCHQVTFKVFATSKQDVCIILRNNRSTSGRSQGENGEVYYKKEMTLSPEAVLVETVECPIVSLSELTFEIVKTFQYGQRTVLSWHAEPDEIRPIPDSAEPALLPEQIKTNEQLFLTGMHLEQYRHATWTATDYYEEALRRDPNDIRCLNAMGLWYIRKGRFAKAEEYLRKAVKLSQKRNPNPYDGEPIYNLAIALKYKSLTPNPSRKERGVYSFSVEDVTTPLSLREGLGVRLEAYDLFWKATWNKAWADAGYFEAAKISTMQGRYEDALDEIDRCLNNNWHNHKARALKAAILRKLIGIENGKLNIENSSAPENLQSSILHLQSFIDESLKYDLFNYGCRYEKYLLASSQEAPSAPAILAEMKEMLRKSAQNYDELALDYCAAGLTDEARAIWQIAIEEGATSPMTWYYLFAFCGETDALAKAEAADSTYCFPNRAEDIIALEAAKQYAANSSLFTLHSSLSKAPYYLGCLYYAARQYDLAIENWERSAELDPTFPTVWRNLALGRFNKQGRQSEAVEYMERAFHLDENDERVLMELDQLYKRLHKPHAERLAFLQQYPELIRRRDDLILEEATLLNMLGRYEEAKQLIDNHTFHPWEGGEGKVSGQYQMCRLEIAKRSLTPTPSIPSKARRPVAFRKERGVDTLETEKAIRLLEECLVFPHHLGEGKLYGAQDNDFFYFLGIAHEILGEKAKAVECFLKGTEGPTEPAAAMYYNDAKPDKIFYAALCYRKLGQEDKARSLFNKLINYGKQHIFEKQMMDYFAVSLPDLLIWEDSLDTKNFIHCKYMLALGYYGMGDNEKALKYLAEVEALDNNHLGVRQFRTLIESLTPSPIPADAPTPRLFPKGEGSR